MNKYSDKYQKWCVWIIEMSIIILGAFVSFIAGAIGVFTYGFMMWDKRAFFDGIVAFFAIFSFINASLSMPILLYVDRMQIWTPPVEPQIMKIIRFIYSLAIFFFMLSTTALAILYQDDCKTFWSIFLFLGGGFTLPILVYCAQFLFQPRPRLRFISSLLLIPACVLWIWYLLAFWAGL